MRWQLVNVRRFKLVRVMKHQISYLDSQQYGRAIRMLIYTLHDVLELMFHACSKIR